MAWQKKKKKNEKEEEAIKVHKQVKFCCHDMINVKQKLAPRNFLPKFFAVSAFPYYYTVLMISKNQSHKKNSQIVPLRSFTCYILKKKQSIGVAQVCNHPVSIKVLHFSYTTAQKKTFLEVVNVLISL